MDRRIDYDIDLEVDIGFELTFKAGCRQNEKNLLQFEDGDCVCDTLEKITYSKRTSFSDGFFVKFNASFQPLIKEIGDDGIFKAIVFVQIIIMDGKKYNFTHEEIAGIVMNVQEDALDTSEFTECDCGFKFNICDVKPSIIRFSIPDDPNDYVEFPISKFFE